MYKIVYLLILSSFMTCIFNQKDDKRNLSTPAKEKIVIDHGLELYKSLQNHESDCFKKVTLTLVNGCASLNIDSSQNMEYALMLTLCELSSVQFSVPDECKNLEELGSGDKSHDVVQPCVQKLANLPQTWTTYSGYFRDVVLICFAIRSPLEKEILERLHLNITLNQAKNFDMLLKQQDYLISWRKDEIHHLEYLKNSQNELLKQIKSIQGVHNQTATEIQFILNALLALESHMDSTITKYNQVIQNHVHKMSDELREVEVHQQNKFNTLFANVLINFEAMNSHFAKMIVVQNNILDNWNQTYSLQLKYFDDWKETIKTMNLSLDDILQKTVDNAHFLQENLNVIHDQVSTIIFPFRWIQDIWSRMRRLLISFIVHSIMIYSLFSHFNGSIIKKTIMAVSLVKLNSFAVEQALQSYDSKIGQEDYYVFLMVLVLEWVALYGVYSLTVYGASLRKTHTYNIQSDQENYSFDEHEYSDNDDTLSDSAEVPDIIQPYFIDGCESQQYHYKNHYPPHSKKDQTVKPLSKLTSQKYHFHRYYNHE